jgi:hypothetical protein
MQLLRYTLDIIQSVNANHDLAPFKSLLQSVEPLLYTRELEPIDKLQGIDTDWERADLAIPPSIFHTVGHGLQTQDTRTGGEEMSGVIVRMESDRQCNHR